MSISQEERTRLRLAGEQTPDAMIGQALAGDFVTWEEVSSAPSPGKFQGVPDADRPLAIALNALHLNGFGDGDITASDGAWIGRLERWLISEDSNGFVSLVEYATTAEAVTAEREIQGISEEDERERTYSGLITDPIGTAEARFIAQEWHGGQASALYAFASSGHLDAEAALRELRVSTADVALMTPEEEYRFMELIDFLERSI